MAASWVETSHHIPTVRRLCRAAVRVLSRDRKAERDAARSGTLRTLMREYEKKIIRQALQTAEGSVSHAARLLGLTHQALIYIIEKRHRDLMTERKPKVRRRRAVFKKPTLPKN